MVREFRFCTPIGLELTDDVIEGIFGGVDTTLYSADGDELVFGETVGEGEVPLVGEQGLAAGSQLSRSQSGSDLSLFEEFVG